MFSNLLTYGLKWLKLNIQKRPLFLNYPFSAICSLRCVMCNFYVGERRKKISPDELEKIIKGKLFRNIEEISFSGGEPFLEKDIGKYVLKLVCNLPRLRGIYINTNGYNSKKIKDSLPILLDICKKKNIKLMIVLSLDGLEEAHNYSRQKTDAWKRLLESLQTINELKIPVNVLMTLHKYNFSSVASVYHFCKKRNINIALNIAVEIGRLKNSDIVNDFEMNKLQKYYIWQFIQSLVYSSDYTVLQHIWYKELAALLLREKPRSLPCLAQKQGVFLNYDGDISYCAIYNKTLENYHSQNNDKNFFDHRNLKKIKKEMINNYCKFCMHNYQNIPRIVDLLNYCLERIHFKRLFDTFRNIIISNSYFQQKRKNISKVVILGCFGTETIGDKIILENIVSFFQKKHSKFQIYIASLIPQYTKTTILEYKWENVFIINYKNLIKSIGTFDVAIFGGGPIMGNFHTFSYQMIAKIMRKYNNKTIIWGAGWGPFDKRFRDKLYKKWSLKFITNSQIVAMRDEKSCKDLNNYLPNKKIECIPDPAYANILSQRNKLLSNNPKENNVLGISFRGWPKSGKYKELLENHIISIAECTNHYIEKYNGRVLLIPMNTFYIGGDDRYPLMEIEDKIINKSAVINMTGFYSVDETLQAFAQCSHFVGMRFHSIAIATALGIPTIGIDYIIPQGKITHFFNALNCTNYLLQLGEFTENELITKIDELVTNSEDVCSLLLQYGQKALIEYQTFEYKIDQLLK